MYATRALCDHLAGRCFSGPGCPVFSTDLNGTVLFAGLDGSRRLANGSLQFGSAAIGPGHIALLRVSAHEPVQRCPGRGRTLPFWTAAGANSFSRFRYSRMYPCFCELSGLRPLRAAEPRQPAFYPSCAARTVLSFLSIVPPFQRPKSAQWRTGSAGCSAGETCPSF